MILEELKKLAEREQLLSDEGYGPQKIHALIAIDREGNFHGLQSQITMVAGGTGKPRPQPALYSMPSPLGRRAAADSSQFLYDKSDYVFGVGPFPFAKLENRKSLFRELVHEALAETDDDGLKAVSLFLEKYDRGEIVIDALEDQEPGAVYGFQDLDDPSARISDRPKVQNWWRSRRGASKAETGACLLCGRVAAIVRNHPEIKSVPGANPAGAALVSFNAPAFTSFGFSGPSNYRNAPFCRNCADAYTRALNRLLSPGFPDPRNPGQTLPVGNYRLSNDTVAVFWSSGSKFSAFFGPALSGDSGAVAAIRNPKAAEEVYAAPHSGSLPAIDSTRFYSLILSGAQGRVVLRSSFALTMAEVVANLRRYFDDIDLVPMYASEPPVLPLFLIIRSLQAPGARSTVASMLAQQVYESAVRGTRYPPSLLDAALRRLRAGEAFSRARIAIIKAVLNGRFRADISKQWKEITMALDPENTELGYRLGRLFAVLEKLQQEAQGSLNATIADRMFGAAIATPVVVFSRLVKLSMHHLSKLEKRRGDSYRIQIQAIYDGLPANAFPSTLPLEQQGLFAVGYYHQRADLWTSKKGEGAAPTEPTPTEAQTKGASS